MNMNQNVKLECWSCAYFNKCSKSNNSGSCSEWRDKGWKKEK